MKTRSTTRHELACGIIILYNPDPEMLQRGIESSLPQVERLYLIDNSDRTPGLKERLTANDKITYIALGGNKGIARALNVGCKRAQEEGFSWAVTLDQDSVIPEGYVEALSKFVKSRPNETIGIVGTSWGNTKRDGDGDTKAGGAVDGDADMETFGALGDDMEAFGALSVFRVITSGSFTNLSAWGAIGGFKEELFIDCVDTEYCLNLLKSGYKVYQLSDLCFEHHLGNNTYEICLFGRHICCVTNHSASRYYYMARNYLAVARNYRDTFPEYTRRVRREACTITIKIILFEKNKCTKLAAIRRGVSDYRRNITGVMTDPKETTSDL